MPVLSAAERTDAAEYKVDLGDIKMASATATVPVKLNLSGVQDAEAFNFRRAATPRH